MVFLCLIMRWWTVKLNGTGERTKRLRQRVHKTTIIWLCPTDYVQRSFFSPGRHAWVSDLVRHDLPRVTALRAQRPGHEELPGGRKTAGENRRLWNVT